MDDHTTSATAPTMSAIVGTTHLEGAPEQMMMAAPAKRITRPVPRSVMTSRPRGRSSVPQSLA